MSEIKVPKEREITAKEIIEWVSGLGSEVWHKKTTLIRMVSSGLAVGVFLAFGSGEEYTASTRLLPYRNASATSSGLSGLAGLAGIRIQGGVGDQTITADLYPEVVGSLDFRIKLAETPLSFYSVDRQVTFVEYFRDHRKQPLTELISEYTMKLPGKLASQFRPATEHRKAHPTMQGSSTKLKAYNQHYLDLVNQLSKRLTVTFDRKTSIITISGTMPDAHASADLVRVASGSLMERIIDFESRKAGEQFRFIQEQHKLASDTKDKAQLALAKYSDRNRVLMTATSMVERESLQREYEQSYEIYQQLSRELEQSRIKMNQDTPMFTIIEEVTIPAGRSQPKRTRMIIACAMAAAMLGIMQIAIKKSDYLRETA